MNEPTGEVTEHSRANYIDAVAEAVNPGKLGPTPGRVNLTAMRRSELAPHRGCSRRDRVGWRLFPGQLRLPAARPDEGLGQVLRSSVVSFADAQSRISAPQAAPMPAGRPSNARRPTRGMQADVAGPGGPVRLGPGSDRHSKITSRDHEGATCRSRPPASGYGRGRYGNLRLTCGSVFGARFPAVFQAVNGGLSHGEGIMTWRSSALSRPSTT